MVGWHHWLNGHEFEQTPGVSDGQRSLVCCSPWGHKELDTTGWLNWAETKPNSLCLLSCSVISDSSSSHGLYPASVLCPWDFFFFSRQEYWNGFHFLLQGISLTQESNSPLLHGRWLLYCWAMAEAPKSLYLWSIFKTIASPDKFHFEESELERK